MSFKVDFIDNFDALSNYTNLFKTSNILDDAILVLAQNRHTASFLEQNITKQTKISAGLNFMLIEQALLYLFTKIDGLEDFLGIVNSEIERPPLREAEAKLVIFKELERIFNSDNISSRPSCFDSLQNYIDGSNLQSEKIYELASYFGPLFLGYTLNNKSLITAFEEGRLSKGINQNLIESDHFKLQSNLWNSLFNLSNTASYPLFGSLLNYVVSKKLNFTDPNLKIVFVGSNFLKPSELDFFIYLGKFCTINYLAITPIDFNTMNSDNNFITTYNKSWLNYYKQLIANDDVAISYNHTPSNFNNSLALLQHNIRFNLPNKLILQDDNSINILQSSSFNREIEIVKEEVLNLLKNDSSLQCHDIAIIADDIKTYIPYLESNFNNLDDYPMPFVVVDYPKISEISEVILALLGLNSTRFSRKDIFALFSSSAFSIANNIDDKMLDLLETFCERYNAIFSFDANHKKELKIGSDELYTWQKAFDFFCTDVLLHNALKQDFSKGQQSKLGDLIYLLDNLYNDVKNLSLVKYPFATHLRLIENLVRKYLNHKDYLEPVSLVFKNITESLKTVYNFENFDDKLFNFSTIKNYIENLPALKERRKPSSFIKNGIFCSSLKLAKALPFKVVFFMGLNDGDFPLANSTSPSFNLDSDSLHYTKNESLQSFIEIIAMAKTKIYFIYKAKDDFTGMQLEPSSVLEDLALFANNSLPLSSTNHPWLKPIYPLQNFAMAKCALGFTPPFSKQIIKLSNIYFNNAKESYQKLIKPKVNIATNNDFINYSDLSKLLSSQLSYFLDKHLKVKQLDEKLLYTKESETLNANALDKWKLEQEILKHTIEAKTFEAKIVYNVINDFKKAGALNNSTIGNNETILLTKKLLTCFASFNSRLTLSSHSQLYNFYLTAGKKELDNLAINSIFLNYDNPKIIGTMQNLILDGNTLIFCAFGNSSFKHTAEAYLLYLILSVATAKNQSSNYRFKYCFFSSSNETFINLEKELMPREEADTKLRLVIDLFNTYHNKATVLHATILKNIKFADDEKGLESFVENYTALLTKEIDNKRTFLNKLTIETLDNLQNASSKNSDTYDMAMSDFYKYFYVDVFKWQSEITLSKKKPNK